MKAYFKKYILNFKRPGGTSRGILHTKETYFLIVENEGKRGVGECALFRGLSCDDRPDYETKLLWVCDNIAKGAEWLLKETLDFPSLQFGIEQAFLSLDSSHPFELFPSKFTEGEAAIEINGLVWMGSEAFMKQQLIEKIESGFTTIKLKIGALDFDTELNLLKFIRREFSNDKITIRVDANGAFHPSTALEKLKQLSQYQLHSIEQPIKPHQWEHMADLCDKTPLPIALDEELIGVFNLKDKQTLLETIQPQFIILKPSLVGGFAGSKEWINLAESDGIGWWITSALESNVGLNAIAQYTFDLKTTLPQGLGTGGLFTNNFDAPLQVLDGKLHYNRKMNWKFDL